MMNNRKTLVLTLALAVISIVFTAGCGSTETTAPAATTAVTTTTPPPATTVSPFSQAELQQIVADSKTATMNTQTYKLKMNATSRTAYDDKAQSEGMSMTANVSFDVPQNQIMMSFIMNSDTGPASAVDNVRAELYLLTDYVYLNFDVPGFGTQWVKVPVTEEILDSFDVNMLKDEMDVLDVPVSIEFLKYDNFNGVDCYVLKYVPNDDNLRDYVKNQIPDGMDIDWEKVGDVADMFQDLSYNVWIAKDTKYYQKIEMHGIILLTGDYAKSENVSFDKAAVEYGGTMVMYDHNSPVSIVLPAEAENAIEMSPDMFLE